MRINSLGGPPSLLSPPPALPVYDGKASLPASQSLVSRDPSREQVPQGQHWSLARASLFSQRTPPRYNIQYYNCLLPDITRSLRGDCSLHRSQMRPIRPMARDSLPPPHMPKHPLLNSCSPEKLPAPPSHSSTVCVCMFIVGQHLRFLIPPNSKRCHRFCWSQ